MKEVKKRDNKAKEKNKIFSNEPEETNWSQHGKHPKTGNQMWRCQCGYRTSNKEKEHECKK
jgi:hypothetical protein